MLYNKLKLRDWIFMLMRSELIVLKDGGFISVTLTMVDHAFVVSVVEFRGKHELGEAYLGREIFNVDYPTQKEAEEEFDSSVQRYQKLA